MEAKIYYYKGFFPKKEVDMKDYELVCNYPVHLRHGDKVPQILETLFSLFNWEHEGFQPTDKEIGFNRPDTVYHTSMSMGDIIHFAGRKYRCEAAGWKQIEA